jgi:hypothetical protein
MQHTTKRAAQVIKHCEAAAEEDRMKQNTVIITTYLERTVDKLTM